MMLTVHLYCALLALLPLAGEGWPGLLTVGCVITAVPSLPDNIRQQPWGLLTVPGSLLAALAYGFGAPAWPLVCLVLAGLMAVYHLEPDREAGVVLLVALAVMVSASQGPGLYWLAIAALWLVTLPRSLSATAPWWLGLVAGGLGMVLLPLIPRWGGTSETGLKRTGFEEQVQVGDVDVLLSDPEPVLRVTFPRRLAEPPYLRGAVQRFFRGDRWLHLPRTTAPLPRSRDPEPIQVVSLGEDVPIITLGATTDVASKGRRFLRQNGGLWLPEDGLPVDEWTVWSSGGWFHGEVVSTEPLVDLTPYLQTPPLDPAVRALAMEWTQGQDQPADIATALTRGLGQHASYSMSPYGAGAEDVVADFLLRRRQGFCQDFASALVLLSRASGLPARMVSGFHGGEEVAPRVYEFRNEHAHAWVEVYIPERGWVTLDATRMASAAPPERVWSQMWTTVQVGWRQWLAFDERDQSRMLQSVATGIAGESAPTWLAWGLLVLPWLLMALLLRRSWGQVSGQIIETATAKDPVQAELWRAAQHLESRGLSRSATVPWLMWAGDCRTRLPEDVGRALTQLVELHYALRFGGAVLDDQAAQAARLAEQIVAWET